MFRRTLTAVALAALALPGLASAQQAQFGTALEARAMLDKAVVAVRGDKAKALESFNAGATGGFRDRDLYPFCANASDGMFTAHPTLRGKPVRDLKDSTGRAFGEDIMRAGGTDGTVNEVAYLFPRPTGGDAVPKVTYVTKIGDQICGVGYYK